MTAAEAFFCRVAFSFSSGTAEVVQKARQQKKVSAVWARFGLACKREASLT